MVHSGINPDVDVPTIAFRVVVNYFSSMGVDLELRNEWRRVVDWLRLWIMQGLLTMSKTEIVNCL